MILRILLARRGGGLVYLAAGDEFAFNDGPSPALRERDLTRCFGTLMRRGG